MLNLNDPFLIEFKSELLRWNRQISLVSRQQTDVVLDTLLYQSLSGFRVLQEHVNSFVDNNLTNNPENDVDNPVDKVTRGILYFDLGSGGGLPGVVWAREFMDFSNSCRAFLVEPREKRSWFLERTIRNKKLSLSSNGFSCKVISGRWGEPFSFNLDNLNNPLVVVSMKALHLDDEAVARGLASVFCGERVRGQLVICRYFPEGQRLDAELRKILAFPEEGSALENLPNSIFTGGEVLSVPAGGFLPSSLVVSRYTI